jgi:hypothetical protein
VKNKEQFLINGIWNLIWIGSFVGFSTSNMRRIVTTADARPRISGDCGFEQVKGYWWSGVSRLQRLSPPRSSVFPTSQQPPSLVFFTCFVTAAVAGVSDFGCSKKQSNKIE